MKLLNKADTVIRVLLPEILEANGLKFDANRLRNLNDFSSHLSILEACGILEGIRLKNIEVRNIAHFCEKVIWSAVAEDVSNFSIFIDEIHKDLLKRTSSNKYVN
ncbi:MAG TPA: hypothetical protein ENI76_07855 [Ignavibacteria bacterium]|nr:hypothetical protein [Ignavibacteria bacterium]